MTSRDFEKVYAIVRQVPQGKVVTYGQVAFWLGWTNGARTVGWAMRATPSGSGVPWHRVVNSQGRISLEETDEQRVRLEAEGVRFNEAGRINLREFMWEGTPVLGL
jgi:methylated-DNA-protein-cysteine methyltransferase-like protein